MPTTIGRQMLNRSLPEGYKVDRTVNKDDIDDLLGRIARERPGEYKDTVHRLMRNAERAAYESGSTLGIKDTYAPIDRRSYFDTADEMVESVMSSDMPDEEKRKALGQAFNEIQNRIIDETYGAALAADNPFARQVAAKARGKPDQLTAIMSTPGVYQDSEDATVPVFIRRSFAEGLKPHEYFAGTYGARKGVLGTKFATRDAGYLGKQLNNAAMRLQVTRDDCETPNGIPVDPSDSSNTGSVLAHDVGGYKRGTVITPDVQKDLAKRTDEIIVRSPTTCSEPKGVCKQCAGVRESGGFPELGDNVGVNAVSALAERVAQGSLDLKHCISLDTKVLRSDWSECRICDLKVGDEVMGSDKEGCMRPVKVLNTFDNGLRECWRTEFIHNGSHHAKAERVYLDSTLDHKILSTRFVTNQKDEALNEVWREMPVGRRSREFHALSPSDFDDTGCGFKRIGCEPLGMKPTMDIEVDHPDHMFVLANGLIVSNSGGLGGEEGKDFSGFPVVSQLVEVPRNFPHGAAVAEKGGEVSGVREAPQGGHWIDVDGEQHYTPGQLPPIVEKGDTVEAGDQLAQGVVNPRDVVRLKGLGEGRRYFTERFTKAMQDSGYAADRRNVELLSRALFDDVEVENTSDYDGISDAIPGDIMAYGSVAHNYKPRKTSEARPVERAEGSYLEEPALHYTVGTRLSRSMIDRLGKHGYSTVRVNDEPPAFKPRMASLRDLPGREKDWVAQLGMNYLKKNLLENAQTGARSQHHSLHPVPAMARGRGLGDIPGGIGY